MTDYNNANMNENINNKNENHSKLDWFSKHPWLTVFLILLAITVLPGLIAGALMFTLKLAVVALFILLGFAMTVITVKIIDEILSDISNDADNNKQSNATNACKKTNNNKHWKAKHSNAPDGLLALASNGSTLARNVAIAYDDMLNKVNEAGANPDDIKNEYASRMDSITDGITMYEKIKVDPNSYPDADKLMVTTQTAVNALIEQFNETVRKTNLSKVTDATLKMQTIVDATPHDDSETILHDDTHIPVTIIKNHE